MLFNLGLQAVVLAVSYRVLITAAAKIRERHHSGQWFTGRIHLLCACSGREDLAHIVCADAGLKILAVGKHIRCLGRQAWRN